MPAAITTAPSLMLIDAGAPGFEPGIAGPKPAALPLGYAPLGAEYRHAARGLGACGFGTTPRVSAPAAPTRQGRRRRVPCLCRFGVECATTPSLSTAGTL